jgi:hypothetical protein
VDGLFDYRLELKTPDGYNFSHMGGANLDLDGFIGTEINVGIELAGKQAEEEYIDELMPLCRNASGVYQEILFHALGDKNAKLNQRVNQAAKGA